MSPSIINFSLILFLLGSPLNAKIVLSGNGIYFEYKNKNTLNNYIFSRSLDKTKLGFNLQNNLDNFKANLHMTIHNENNISLNHSYIEYKNNNQTYGVGSLNRNWSFSPHSSLILSSNARPFKSIYFKLEKDKASEKKLLKYLGKMSLEIFNGQPEDESNPNNSMLFGMRITTEPTENFKMEAVNLSQWGGNGFDSSPLVIPKSFFGNTNDGAYGNINQIAGIGFSYTFHDSQNPIKIYSQVVGEDEAGNLPSCLMYLYGTNWQNNSLNLKPKLGLEFIDTRIDYTKNGFCGPNTAYNNSTYKYTNKGVVMGAPIDSEGKSFEFFGGVDLNSNTSIDMSIKRVFINQDNRENHRLSSKSQDGYIYSTDLTWNKNNFFVNGKISIQNFELEKINSSEGLSINIFSSLKF